MGCSEVVARAQPEGTAAWVCWEGSASAALLFRWARLMRQLRPMNTLLMGAAAGAVGTAGLNIATYLDMLIRGRPSSDVPARTAERIAAGVGVDLAGSAGDTSEEQGKQVQQARSSALGGLEGYVAGLGVGAMYGVLRPWLGDAPVALTGVWLGAAAMLAGDLPSVLTNSTDVRTWGMRGWLADAVPHLAYGLLTAYAYEAFTAGPLKRKSIGGADYVAAALRHSRAELRRP